METTIAPVVDGDCTPIIHAALQEKELLPGVHLVDSGYVYAQWLLNSQRDYGVDLLGPTRSDYHWQARVITGRHERRRALRPVTSWWIGSFSR